MITATTHILDLLTEADGDYHDGINAFIGASHDGETATITLSYVGSDGEITRTDTFAITPERA